MTTFATTFKREIARIARKELKQEISTLRRASSAYRSEIAALKRDIKVLQADQKALQRKLARGQGVGPGREAEAQPAVARRRSGGFSADTLRAKREALGFTQAQMGKLLGVSTLSANKWESGRVQPRAAQLERIAVTMKMGKREARTLLAA